MQQNTQIQDTQLIDLHIRTYRSLLKSTSVVKIEKLIESHNRMKPLLHEKGEGETIDMAAFIYVLLRLPAIMSKVKTIILGQSYSVFKNNAFQKIRVWKEVESPGRRRKMFFDGRESLAMYIASVSDVDDIITLLSAFQIEWNKLHVLLSHAKQAEQEIETYLNREDIEKVKNIWGDEYHKFLTAIKNKSVDFTVQLLSGSYVEYAKATQQWWNHIVTKLRALNIAHRPIYFVSSNMHSVVNLLMRFVQLEEKRLIEYLHNTKNQGLIRIWKEINSGMFPANRENFLYYVAKKYARTHPEFVSYIKKQQERLGIHHIPASHYLDIDVQIIEIRKLAGVRLDERLHVSLPPSLNQSRAIIVNIDYPLGWAAYQILTEIGQNVDSVRGAYIMGKAATLNGAIGDIMLPSTVFDQHTKNNYVFNNAFSKHDFSNIFKSGLVLDNQKTVTAKGTFLQSGKLIEQWYKDGFTTIEMEAGPYMNAIYEFSYYNRYEESQFVNLTNTPFEVGIAHYASDTPYSKAKNMGVRNLSYEGVEPTYAISLVIIKKIIERETSYFS